MKTNMRGPKNRPQGGSIIHNPTRPRVALRAISRIMRKRCDKLGLRPPDAMLTTFLAELFEAKKVPWDRAELDKLLLSRFPRVEK